MARTNLLIFCDNLYALIKNKLYLSYLTDKYCKIGIVLNKNEQSIAEQFSSFSNIYSLDINLYKKIYKNKGLSNQIIMDDFIHIKNKLSTVRWDETISLSNNYIMLSYYSFICETNSFSKFGIYLNTDKNVVYNDFVLNFSSFCKNRSKNIYLNDEEIFKELYKIKTTTKSNNLLVQNIFKIKPNLYNFCLKNKSNNNKILYIDLNTAFFKENTDVSVLFKSLQKLNLNKNYAYVFNINSENANNFYKRITKSICKNNLFINIEQKHLSATLPFIDICLTNKRLTQTIAAKYCNKKVVVLNTDKNVGVCLFNNLSNNETVININKIKFSNTLASLIALTLEYDNEEISKLVKDLPIAFNYKTIDSCYKERKILQSNILKKYINTDKNIIQIDSKSINNEFNSITLYLSKILKLIKSLTYYSNNTKVENISIQFSELLISNNSPTLELVTTFLNNQLLLMGNIQVNQSILLIKDELYNIKNLLKKQLTFLNNQRNNQRENNHGHFKTRINQ